MDDAMIISCGHSVGNAGRRRVMETVRDIFCSLQGQRIMCLIVCLYTADWHMYSLAIGLLVCSSL
jgi:hypothetical protein